MIRQFEISALIATMLLFIGIINRATCRSIDTGNFMSIDRSEVPARYVYEIDEDQLSKTNKSAKTSQGYLNSSLLFDMPIAVAILSAVMLLICCFCCLRCAVTYDGVNRNGFYGRWKMMDAVAETVGKMKPIEPIKK